MREAHVALAERAKGSSLIDFVGNVEGTQILHGAADVVVTDGFTGNVALKLIEGTSQRTIEAIREVAEQSTAGDSAGCCCASRCTRCARTSIPRRRAARTCSGCGGSASSPTAASPARGFAQAILLAARGVRGDVVGRTREALEEAGARRRSPAASAEASSVRSP